MYWTGVCTYSKNPLKPIEISVYYWYAGNKRNTWIAHVNIFYLWDDPVKL